MTRPASDPAHIEVEDLEIRYGTVLAVKGVSFSVKAGEQLVPIGLKPEQIPATALVPGQKVQLVHVPALGETETGKPSGDSPKTPLKASSNERRRRAVSRAQRLRSAAAPARCASHSR